MNISPERITALTQEVESIIRQINLLPAASTKITGQILDRCRDCLEQAPATDTPVYIHITGTDKSFKTSYLLDLFDHEVLRGLFSVKVRTTSENTAVPCMVKPVEGLSSLSVSQVSISTGRPIRNNLTREQFNRLYDLASGAQPDDYLIVIEVPAHETPMELAAIEYPGIKQGADSMEAQKQLHKKFEENMMTCLVKYPGILVACFQHKVAIPKGHPMDAILKKYGQTLKTSASHHKLPLVLSLQGETAVASYCGNTNVVKDIQSDFKSFTDFDSMIQLINPCNREYPASFIPPGPHVEEWIETLSRYKTLNEIKEQIRSDGGIAWSRNLLKELCTTSYIKEALNNIFFKPWIIETENLVKEAANCLHEATNYDESAEIKERMRQVILDDEYLTLRRIFDQELSYTHENTIDDHQVFWTGVFSNYLDQFFRDTDRSNLIAGIMWEKILKRIDPEQKGFFGTREKDLPYIIMNMAEFYVPNALMRGDYLLMEKDL